MYETFYEWKFNMNSLEIMVKAVELVLYDNNVSNWTAKFYATCRDLLMTFATNFPIAKSTRVYKITKKIFKKHPG